MSERDNFFVISGENCDKWGWGGEGSEKLKGCKVLAMVCGC